MKKLFIVGVILGAFITGCDYSDRSNGNIDAAFKSEDPRWLGGNIYEREMNDPANWIYEKELPRDTMSIIEEDTIFGEQTIDRRAM